MQNHFNAHENESFISDVKAQFDQGYKHPGWRSRCYAMTVVYLITDAYLLKKESSNTTQSSSALRSVHRSCASPSAISSGSSMHGSVRRGNKMGTPATSMTRSRSHSDGSRDTTLDQHNTDDWNKCPDCSRLVTGSRANRKKNLIRHAEEQHGELQNPQICHICHRSFANSRNLSRHQKAHCSQREETLNTG